MNTRMFFLGLGLCTSGAAFAGTMGPISAEPYDGFYLGADIGVANLMDKESTPYQPGVYDRHQFGATGLVGGGMIGYDYSVNERFKLGLEGFINATALNLAAEQLYNPFPSYNVSMRYNTGVRVLPGYEFSPGTIGHVLLGYSYGQLHINDNGDYGYIDRNIAANGFQAGLGLNVPFYLKNLSLRGDLIYSNYGTYNSLGSSTSFTPQNYSNNFSVLEGNLSLVYKCL